MLAIAAHLRYISKNGRLDVETEQGDTVRGKSAVHELGELLQLDSGTLTPLLKRLEAGGLVARVRDVADERRVHISLTAAGRRLKGRAAQVPGCLLAATQCPVDALVQLTQQIQLLRDRIKAA